MNNSFKNKVKKILLEKEQPWDKPERKHDEYWKDAKEIKRKSTKDAEKDYDKKHSLDDLSVAFDFPETDWKSFGTDKRKLNLHASRYADMMMADPETLEAQKGKTGKRSEYENEFKTAMQPSASEGLNEKERKIRRKVINNIAKRRKLFRQNLKK